MAEAFKKFKAELGLDPVTVYTCPAGTTAIITAFRVTNKDGTNDCDLFFSWTDASDSDDETALDHGVNVPANSSYLPFDGEKDGLEAGDSLVASASAEGDLVVSGFVLEIS